MHSPSLTTAVRRIRSLTAPLPEGLSDRDLLRRFLKSGDESAFAGLVSRHGSTVLGVCRRVLNNGHDAEDAFQATFLVLARRAGSIQKTASVGCWLHGVAFRVASKLKGRLAKQPRSANVPDIAGDSSEDVSWREVRRVLDEEVNRLPERLRLPVLLCYFEGKTRDEAAEALGCSITTFRGRLEDGRMRLRTRLAKRGIELSAALLAISAATDGAAIENSLIESTLHTIAGHGQDAIKSLAKGIAMSSAFGKTMLSLGTLVLAIGIGTTLLAFRGQAGDKPGSGFKEPETPVKTSALSPELLAMMQAADRVWVVSEPTDTTVPEPEEVLKGMSPPGKGYSFAFKADALKKLPRKGHRWIVFLKSIEEVDHIPKCEPIAGERWYIPEDEKTVAALRAYVPRCAWSDEFEGLRLGVYPRVNAEEPTLEVVLQNMGKKDIVVQQFRGNYFDGWFPLTFEVTSPAGKKYHIERIGPPQKDSDAPRERTLQAGERYIHVVRLARWLIPGAPGRGFGLSTGNAPEGLFAVGGDFTVQATYALTDSHDPTRWWIGKLQSKPVTLSVPKHGPYGEPAGDFRLRLHPAAGQLRVGDALDLICDLQFAGKGKRSIQTVPDYAAVELDGKWYQCLRDGSIEGKTEELAPGSERAAWLNVKPDANWIYLRKNPDADDTAIKEAIPFQLATGAHTLRVAYTFSKTERAISNAVTIDVASDGWGDASGGVKARMRLAKTKFAPGEPLTFHLDLKNVGRKSWSIPAVPFNCMIEMDGRWYILHDVLDYKAAAKELKPNGELVPFVTVTTDANWKTPAWPGEGDPKTDFLSLALKPGKHKVKASFSLGVDNSNPNSNSVEIEVSPFALDPAIKAMALGADRIWVVKAPTKEKPIPVAIEVLKGPRLPELSVFDLRLLPGDDPKKKFIVFLKAEEDGKGVPNVKVWDSTQWHQPYTSETVEAIRNLLLPYSWGEEKGGLRMGLRLRKAELALDQPVVAEVVFENNGKQDWKMTQHRFNIYDYWPDTWFEVKAPDGKKWQLRKQAGAIDEADNPYVITLKAGESYIQAVRLDTWPAHTNWEDTSKPLKNVFTKPGGYTITAHHRYSPPLDLAAWTADYTSNNEKLVINAADEWGDAASGIKSRLRLTKTSFKANEPLEFALDLKNTGDETIEDHPIPMNCLIDLDGVEYRYTAPLGYPTGLVKLEPGKEYVPHVQVKTDQWWCEPRDGKALVLVPGKYKLRVIYPLPGKEPILVKSPGVEFQVISDEKKEPDLLTLAAMSDRIVIGTIDWQGDKPRLKPSRMLKGPNNRWQPDVQPIDIPTDADPLPKAKKDNSPNDKNDDSWILFLKVIEDGTGVPKLSPAANHGWYRRAAYSIIPALLADKLKPTEKGTAVHGLTLALRAEYVTVRAGDEVRLDVVLTNELKESLRVLQHRYNVYDYWPMLTFTVTLADGKTITLHKVEGPFTREDFIDEYELRAGASYTHVVRLNHWEAEPRKRTDEDQSVPKFPFREPGTYKVQATYKAPVGFKNINPTTALDDWPFWHGELTSNTITIEVKK